MKIIVQKFGGTSVAEPAQRERVCGHIANALQRADKVVVVVSAMGRAGSPYATDTLLSLLRENGSGNARETDLLMACGEIISGIILSAKLREQGFRTCFLTGAQAGIITDRTFGDARIQSMQTEYLLTCLQENDVAVVAGFQGKTPSGEITTLGRGGSDTTASALGAALNAEVVEIFTDVDGVMTADPKLIQDARLLSQVTYNEICQLAREGAKVVHPRAVEIAMEKNIPLRVRSTFSDSPGTLVTNRGGGAGGCDVQERLITGVTSLSHITQFRISKKPEDAIKAEREIFHRLAEEGVSLDFISIQPEEIRFTVKEENESLVQSLLEKMGYRFHILPHCAKVAAVGAGMTGKPGVMSRVVDALAAENIAILQSGDSYTSLWCLVKENDMKKALMALHKEFSLGTKEH